MTKRLLVGITLSEMGGAQKVVYNIISSLDQDKYEITLVTSPGGDLIKWINRLNEYRSSSINIIVLPCIKRDISPIHDVKVLFKLYRILKKGNYDIAHFHSSKMGILGRLSAWLARVPNIVFTIHGWGINEYQNPLKQVFLGWAEKLAGKLCTKAICVSEHDMMKGVSKGWICKEKVSVIYNGLDPAPNVKGNLFKLLNIPETTVVVGTIARLQQQKDPVFTIKVFSEIKKRGYNAKLVIIGDGPLKEECCKQIDVLGLNQDVYLLGTRQDARELLNDFDIFTLFSRWEGLPLTIIEAMYAAKPVVAANVGGVPELVAHKENGFLLSSFDVYQAAAYIETLINDNGLRTAMGNLGLQKANELFSKERMIKGYEAVY